MEDPLSLGELCEGGLISKNKQKPLLQKLQTRCVQMLHSLGPNKHPTQHQDIQGARVGTRARISGWFRRKHHSPSENSADHLVREGCSDHFYYVPDQNQFNNGKKSAQRISSDQNENRSDHKKIAHFHSHFHLSHPKIRLNFHSPCCLNSHMQPPHLDFHKNSPKQKGDSQSQTHSKDIPKGFLAVYVGPEHRRFIIPVIYLNHPLFEELLKGMEEEFGFEQNGGLLIPCEVADFELLRSRIGRKNSCKTRNSLYRTHQTRDKDEHAD